jgi:hypothetical protein
MWQLADWKDQPVANQGTTRWLVEGGESLWTMAIRLQEEEEEEEAEPSSSTTEVLRTL